MSYQEMSESEAKRIKQAVESGEYFRQARKWYDVIYHRPLGERSFFILVTFFAFITIVLSASVYLSMQPLRRTVPYIIQSFNLAEDIPYVRSLKYAPEENLNVSVARYLVYDYLNRREYYKYDVAKLEQTFSRLRVTTADHEFANYQELVSPQNPASPFNKYGRNIVREVYPGNMTLEMEGEPKTAKVRYTTNLIDGTKQQQEYWEATIRFYFPQLIVDQQTNKVLQWSPEQNSFIEAQEIVFIVESYVTQQLGQY